MDPISFSRTSHICSKTFKNARCGELSQVLGSSRGNVRQTLSHLDPCSRDKSRLRGIPPFYNKFQLSSVLML